MTRKRLRLLAPLFAAGLVATATACDPGDGSEGTSDGELPRDETLFTIGQHWGTYSDFNPHNAAPTAMGAQGLMYEALFHYEPFSGELEPWLAESGEWVADDEYVITLRDGIEWTDGEPFTADDVVFTLSLRENEETALSPMSEWVDEAVAEGDTTVRVTFSEPRAGEWDEFLFTNHMLAEHNWADKFDTVMEESGDDVRVGTGPYTYRESTEERIVWERNDDWWGIDALGLEMSPRYIVDFANTSNQNAVPPLLQGEVDLSNNYMPAEVINDNDHITGYFNDPAGALPWNTAMLILNHDVAPMGDVEFRRALAHAIDVQDIIDNAYSGLVEPANPTGLLGTWEDLGLIDDELVAEHGFSYDPGTAEQILDDAGYTVDGDWRTTPDGDPIELEFPVQSGWTDWEIAADVIAEGAQAVGINVQVTAAEPGDVDEARTAGEFDLLLNNWSNQSSSPYTHFHYLYELPVRDRQPANNFNRYENEEAWELSQELARYSVDPNNPDFMEPLRQLQEITLTEIPGIPLWYNGVWSQANNDIWTNWPSDGPDTPNHFAGTWDYLWEMGGVKMLADLEPAG